MRCLRPRPGSRIAVDRATSRCPAIPLARGAAQATETQRVRTGRKEVFQGMRKSSVEQHHLSLWHMPSTQTPTSTAPPAPVVPPLVSGRLFLGGLLLSRARLRFAGLPL